jgi:AraC family transcriptional regulator
MTPRIETISEKKLIGISKIMSLRDNKTGELWREFMLRRNEIKYPINSDLISMQVFEKDHFKHFDPNNKFEKWAALEVSEFGDDPEGMKTFLLKEGLYAVFEYKGLSTDNTIFNYIFGEWLPNSQFELDMRPHFEVLGEKYKNNDPNSEEEIWIPIKPKI